MKIRLGFVSNSSSSSFVVISRKSSIDEIDNPKVKLQLSENIISPGEGQIYFRPDAKTIELIKSRPDINWGDFVYEFFSCDEGKNLAKKEFLSIAKEVPEVFQIECFSISQWQPSYSDIKDAVERMDD